MVATLDGIDLSLDALTADAIKLLRLMVPADGSPYWGCFSGGKDSCVIKELARLAGVPVEWHYNVTTIDPPELVHFVRREHPDVSFDRPEMNFFVFAIAKHKGFPTRKRRWCCEHYKERRSPPGRRLIMGIRAEESSRRAKNWGPFTIHSNGRSSVVSPILRWVTEHVWQFIRQHDLPYCCLYDEGFDRLGCIGCPMARKANREKEFARWPGYERKWKELFRKTWETLTGKTQRNGQQWFGDRYFACWEEMWRWWLFDEPLPKEDDKCQGLLEMFV